MMPRPRFDMTVNLGHILIVLGMMGSVFLAYTNIVRSIDNHEQRIQYVERATDRQTTAQNQILSVLATIREDIAAIKARQADHRD